MAIKLEEGGGLYGLAFNWGTFFAASLSKVLEILFLHS